jgi:soluble lytic murein transglycosylase-like protein
MTERTTTPRWSSAFQARTATHRLVLRGAGIAVAVTVAAFAVGMLAPRRAQTAEEDIYAGTALRSQFKLLRQSLDTTAGELELARLELRRAKALLAYSATYQIPADLASLVYDTALRSGLDPELAFRLVAVESKFSPRARSSADALGLAQVQLATARFYDDKITEQALFDPETNLRIGFRYLRDLLGVYGDVKLALLAYNRGPSRVKKLLDEGRDPGNGYASRIMAGYGTGTP